MCVLFQIFFSSNSISTSLSLRQLKCCGFWNHVDWKVASWVRRYPTQQIPASCCINPYQLTNLATCTNGNLINNFYQDGCEAKLGNWYWIIGGVALFVLLLQVGGVGSGTGLYP